MKKRIAIRVISFSIAFVLISLGFSIKLYTKSKNYYFQIQRDYSYSLDEFTSGINNISLSLKKAQYLNTPTALSKTSAKLLCDAEICKNAISKLPAGNKIDALNKFLSQVGNYAIAVTNHLIERSELTDEQAENIAKLSVAAEKIAEIVNETQITYNNSEYWAKELSGKINDEVDIKNISNTLGGLEDELTDYPTLVYDGPYSDHILEKEPKMLENAQWVSKEDSLEIAAKISQYDKTFLKSDGEISGNIPSYRFKGDGVVATVSTKGGYPVFMRKERIIRNLVLTYEEALEKAKNYLKSIELSGFTPTYFAVDENICVFNMAYIQGETICYTDLVKIGVAMDNGEIMLFEGSGYISNHFDREFEIPVFSFDDAEEKLKPNLTIISRAMALIPTDNTEEIRCYEFSCKTPNGEEILIYINTDTLAEEDILILFRTDGGVLVK